MTGLEKIVQQIRDEAQQAADAVIAQAKEEAGQLAAKAAEDARTQSGAILAKSKTDVQNHLAAARSAAELAQRRAVLAYVEAERPRAAGQPVRREVPLRGGRGRRVYLRAVQV